MLRPPSRARTIWCAPANPEMATRTPGATQAGSVEDSFTGAGALFRAAGSALTPGRVKSTANRTPRKTAVSPAAAMKRDMKIVFGRGGRLPRPGKA